MDYHQEWLQRLQQVRDLFCIEADQDRAAKIDQLIRKVDDHQTIIAFCGHFSAGKSSMMNWLMEKDILPSSPIPTSANIVTIGTGSAKAVVTLRKNLASDGPTDTHSVLELPLEDLERLKQMAADGEQIDSIAITTPNDFLPEGVFLMDTPGIDSTDDAHKVATESALHLADAIFYMMDYNHVQSEVNFQFAKTLKDRGKLLFLIVNQIDKHHSFELSFEEYQRSVRDAFATWGIQPDGIFYTTLRDPNHPMNQLGLLRGAMQSLFSQKEALLLHSVERSAAHLIDEHIDWRGKRGQEDRDLLRDPLQQIDVKNVLAEAQALQQRVHTLENTPAQLADDLKKELESLVAGAILTPYLTTELAQEYLQSRRPGFRVGLFFSASKTQQEMDRRLEALYSSLREQVTSQLEWHLKELLVKTVENYGFINDAYRQSIYEWKIEWDASLIVDTVKEGALTSDRYVYQYVKDLAAAVKALYRQDGLRVAESAVEKVKNWSDETMKALSQELDMYVPVLEAYEAQQTREQELTAYRDDLLNVLYGPDFAANEEAIRVHIPYEQASPSQSDVKSTSQLEQPYESIFAHGHDHQNSNAGDDSLLPKKRLVSRIQEPAHSFKHQMGQTAKQLRDSAELIVNIPGFSAQVKALRERADRLDQSLFTVALFGAFSAGKSSFANALMGERVLPVSPNPTTATINKILPPTDKYPHGTVRVKLKDATHMQADVDGSLGIFGKRGSTLEEVSHLLEDIDRSDIAPSAKPHFTFLQAVAKGWESMHEWLGSEQLVDLEAFQELVAREERACFVEWIELYFSCPLTDQGITLVDTPGADSINARHTGVAFEYIKNADAILFVTYYNHAFSQADRDFLTQLGRVKDSFELDKMFFIVNAADLAESQDELTDVVSHIRKNLISCGISGPRIYPVSSQTAILAHLLASEGLDAEGEKIYRTRTEGLATITGSGIESPEDIHDRPMTAEKALELSGITEFERDFSRFTIDELVGMAVRSAESEIRRSYAYIDSMITTAREGEATRAQKQAVLSEHVEVATKRVQDTETTAAFKAVEKEIEELVYYIRQRIFQRFGETFANAFHPSILKDDGRDLKKLIASCLEDMNRAVLYELGQEMRATALRVERYVQKTTGRLYDEMAYEIVEKLSLFVSSKYEGTTGQTPDFLLHFEAADLKSLAGTLGLFKNAKDFFEGGGRNKLRDELERRLQSPVASVLLTGTTILRDTYLKQLGSSITSAKEQLLVQSEEFKEGQLAALALRVDPTELERVRDQLEKMV